jgi:hydroxypyruvate reductase
MEPLQRLMKSTTACMRRDPEAAFARVAPHDPRVTGGGESKVPRALMEKLPALEIVSIMGVGYDKVDVAAALERIAGHAHARRAQRRGGRPRAGPHAVGGAPHSAGRPLCARRPLGQERPHAAGAQGVGRALGIVGLGRIGKAIASRAEAFGMSIAYTGAQRSKPELAYPITQRAGAGRRWISWW